ncbi:hypothetical protein CGZ80_09890 [Rhodopirellula sp. MGV]|nr:hypothetical protein CGZ80_09890 [Rhodopirellula sp. MGV]
MVVAFIALLLASALLPSGADAAEYEIGYGPSASAKAGFRMSVLSEQISQDGVQPLVLRFSSIGNGFTRQRVLRVLLRPRMTYQTRLDYQYAVDVTVPEGITTFELPIEMPCYYRWESLAVEIRENGRSLGRYATRGTFASFAQDWGQEVTIGIVEPTDAPSKSGIWEKMPDVRAITTVIGEDMLPEAGERDRMSPREAKNFIDHHTTGKVRYRVQREASLRESWLAYSQLDIMIVPAPVLIRLERERPARFRALQQWVSSGGDLWTYDLPASGFDRGSWLATEPEKELVQFVKDPKILMQLADGNVNSTPVYQAYSGSFYRNDYVPDQSRNRGDFYKELLDEQNPVTEVIDQEQMNQKLSAFSYGLGRVALINDPDPFPGSYQLWLSLKRFNRSWESRNGVNISGGNESYWHWLIAAVGRPPVTAFVLLNCFFVLLMGPVLYFFLRRRGKLYWLYFLAPAMAFMVTSGLFLYAFVSDGFTNRAKLRQITWIDAKHPVGQSASDPQSPPTYPQLDQIRHTYYTIVDSNLGLKFPLNSLVLPVSNFELIPGYQYRSPDPNDSGDHLIEQLPDARRYYGSFLATRTQAEFLETDPTFGPLPVRFETDKGTPTVTNFGTQRFSSVALLDGKGGRWIAFDLDPDATATMHPASPSTIEDILMENLEPRGSDIPQAYRSFNYTEDRSELESKFATLNRNLSEKVFFAITEVEPERFALPDCNREGCARIIAGVLP